MINATRFTGLGVALATPFSAQDADTVDTAAFRALIRSVRSGGADFLVVLGSTGEAATVRDEEREGIIRAALEESGGLPVVVGVGHNATARTVAMAKESAALGVQGLLVVTPYYNKPQPAGLEAHYRAVAAAADGLPIIAYNVPGRTGLNLAPDILARLWAIPQVIGVKESSGNLAQIGEIARCLPPGKLLLSGDDALALPAIALGASGLVSVAGNAAPAQLKALVSAALAGRRKEAQELHYRLLPLMDALFAESNPAPLKAGLEELSLCSSLPRLPLAGASEPTRQRVRKALQELGLLGASR
ncbi:MAG TPA: 4-hydroxy-tetrahydrodipicolinate synthase [Spirochaetaceae bacterium]|jgi:4-hydroxy-tetrahydrodipicolinate synthase|nr:4-hydroxy-tetrahydrodipicolinate synthase [Spirochaetaceae bacterium]